MSEYDRESMLEMFVFEMWQLIGELEQNVIRNESGYSMDKINEIFRVMHTIKGSAAMMMYNSVQAAAHGIEDLFFYLREKEAPEGVDYSRVTDLVLESVDFIKAEMRKIETGASANGDASGHSERIKAFLNELKAAPAPGGFSPRRKRPDIFEPQPEPEPASVESETYKVVMMFAKDAEMLNVRAFGAVHNLRSNNFALTHEPEDLIDEESSDIIASSGLIMTITTDQGYDALFDILHETVYVKSVTIDKVEVSDKPDEPDKPEAPAPVSEAIPKDIGKPQALPRENAKQRSASANHTISVNVFKLDELVKLMGELVISEAMVTQNPELENLELDSFHKETRQLRKIIKDIQDNVMSMRMVPLATTFFKMHRIVRDMCKQLGKDIRLEVIGEDTEVDKNIIEHIADPLMHIIRNSADHGIETPDKRLSAHKSESGLIQLEARNSGSDVLIIVRDDGAGIDRERVMKKARDAGLLTKPEEDYQDREAYQFIFMPGFSTNEAVTEFSGRGVGMDIVSQNLEKVGGSVIVESTPGLGSAFTLKIPLTLAIVEGMMVRLGNAKFMLPIISIKDSFKPDMNDVFRDPSGNEMITVRGEVYNILRLYEFLNSDSDAKELSDGIMIMVENGDESMLALFADELIGEQQVVVKSMPKYIKKSRGISGCTLLGNGDISLILDVAGLFN